MHVYVCARVFQVFHVYLKQSRNDVKYMYLSSTVITEGRLQNKAFANNTR